MGSCLLQAVSKRRTLRCGRHISIYRGCVGGQFFCSYRPANGQYAWNGIGIVGRRKGSILPTNKELNTKALCRIVANLNDDSLNQHLLRTRIELPDKFAQHFLHVRTRRNDDGIAAFIATDNHLPATAERRCRTSGSNRGGNRRS